MGTPELIYASNEHGISLNTFYTRSEPWEPTILVIKTTTREVSHFPNWSVFTVLINMVITVVKYLYDTLQIGLIFAQKTKIYRTENF